MGNGHENSWVLGIVDGDGAVQSRFGFRPLFAIIEAEHGAEALRCLRRESGFAAAAHAPSALVPFALMNRVYNGAAKLCGDPQFGARVGQTIRLEDFGPFVEYALHGENSSETSSPAPSSRSPPTAVN